MGKFEVMKERVSIKDSDGVEHMYIISPARGEHIGEFFKLLKELSEKFKGKKKSELTEEKLQEEGLSDIPISPESMEIAHMLLMDSLKRTYGKEVAEKDLDEFVTQNLMDLLEPLMNVNVRAHKED